ncbi:OLC1v1004037C3 [Oldenlandia corymbosa var. corymbosa]|uniref:OLC1v1004037C3 n=1 Tax=Oldenlandia corymbosa var. corymbosa TaxID=529605 RepID=A0AAV1DBB6_OLDCO|nr:OLC1v1004037C3 [Oldenlandia corymbosa var. corymbosa]
MNNKENTSSNWSEGPILKMEPMQMKKKKKGGYNLRKSIAWNRAFFTDEGVLDPEELSLISGTVVSSSIEGMSTINEEAMDSRVEDDQFITGSPTLQALEKNLFKGISSACSSGNGETSCLPLKHTSPASSCKTSTSKSSRKVLSTRVAKRAGPANIFTRKPVPVESKLPKAPVSKPRQQSLLATSNSTIRGTASSAKNQILCPVVNKQRIVEPKSYSKGVNIRKGKAKGGPESLPVKSSSLTAKRNKVHPQSSMLASTPLACPQVNKVGISDQKMIQEDGIHTREGQLSEDQDEIGRLGGSLPSNSIIADKTQQHSKVQLSKPSGLRMPSPSLAFFDQSKVSASNRISRRVVDSNPRVEKLSDKRPPAKVPQVSQPNLPSTKSSDASSKTTLPNTSITSGVLEDAGQKGTNTLDKHERNGLDSNEQMTMRMTGNEEKHHPRNDITVTSAGRGVQISDCEIPVVSDSCNHLFKNVYATDWNFDGKSNLESTGSEISKLLSQQNFTPCATEVAGTVSTIKSVLKEENSSNFADTKHVVANESQSGEVDNGKVPSSSMLRSNFMSCPSDLHQPSRCLSNEVETSTGNEDSVLDLCDPLLSEDGNSEKLIGHSQSSAGEIFVDGTYKNVESSKFELEDSVMMDDITENSHIPEAPAQIPDPPSLIAKMSENSVDQSSETGYLSIRSHKLLQLPTACLKVEHLSRNIPGSPGPDCKWIEELTCSENNQKYVSESPLVAISEERGNIAVDDAGTLMTGAVIHTNKITRLSYSELGFDQVVQPVVNQEHLLHRITGSVAYLSDEPSSSVTPSHSSKVLDLRGNESLTMLEPTHRDLFDGSCLENQVADISQTRLSSSSEICNEIQKCDLQTAAVSDPTLHACIPIKLERQCSISEPVNVKEKDGFQKDSVDTVNFSHAGDDSEHFTGGCEPDLIIGHASVVCDQFAESTDCTVESCQQESASCCLLVKAVPEDNIKLLSGHCLNEERDEAAYSEESVPHAVPDKRDPCESEFGSSKEISKTLTGLPAQGNEHDEDESIEWHCVEALRFSYTEFHSSFECRGSLIQEDLTLPEGKQCAVAEEIQVEVCQNRGDLVGDARCDVVALCQEKDEKSTTEIGKKNSLRISNEKNVSILPPKNAVPFSDEWLAAIEAAGEEILTMKGGAVQNSPPDKSAPEPSPWSPVKKKNNAIGPYDCTKYTNN